MDKNYSLTELNQIAKDVITSATHKTILFYGEMGVGKTTLIKEICKELGIKDITHSPTFSLVNEYQTDKGATVYHFDFYRINEEEEAYDMGIEDYLYNDSWCLIEWPEKIKNLVPLDAVEVYLTINDAGNRNIQLKNKQ